MSKTFMNNSLKNNISIRSFTHLRSACLTILFFLLFSISNTTFSQSATTKKPPHYRGLHITQNGYIWISGTQGTILKGRMTSGQLHLDTLKTNYPRKDFRDIWALDDLNAVAISVSDSAVVIKTTDGGKSWQTVYHDETPGIFLDVIEIDPFTGIGFILGDPMETKDQGLNLSNHSGNLNTAMSSSNQIAPNKINAASNSNKSTPSVPPKINQENNNQENINSENINQENNTSKNIKPTKHFKALLTTDYGSSWITIPDAAWSVPLDTLESFFAASGTSLAILHTKANHKKQKYSITVGYAGGGLNPQFHLTQINYTKNPFNDWKYSDMPKKPMHLKGGPAWGCYGLALFQTQKGIAIGGNYAKSSFTGDSSGAIAAYSSDILGGWKSARTPPNGYRSGICISNPISKDTLFKYLFQNKQINCSRFLQVYGEQPTDYFFKTSQKKMIPIAICTGTNGTDISFDGGINWFILSNEKGFNACQWDCKYLIMVGNQGKISSMNLEQMGSSFRQHNPIEPIR